MNRIVDLISHLNPPDQMQTGRRAASNGSNDRWAVQGVQGEEKHDVLNQRHLPNHPGIGPVFHIVECGVLETWGIWTIFVKSVLQLPDASDQPSSRFFFFYIWKRMGPTRTQHPKKIPSGF